MGVASGHTECHVTLFQDWGKCGYSGLRNRGGVRPSTTPPPPWGGGGGGGGVQFFYRMFVQETIVGAKSLSCYTGSRQEVGWKKEETRVSNDF